ncbi:MAG: PAS-domain containing protein [Rhodosalinus sp.]
MEPGLLVVIAVCSLAAAGLAVALITTRRDTARQVAGATDSPLALLVEDSEITDATPAAQDLLDPRGGADWPALVPVFGPRFSGFPADFEQALAQAPLQLTDDHGILRIAPQGPGVLRVTLDDPAPDPVARHRAARRAQEHAAMRAAADLSPHPSWQVDQTGRVTWANAAYLSLARESLAWAEGAALPKLFDLPHAGGPPRRVSLTLPDGDTRRWFDVTASDCGTTRIGLASDVDAVVHGETAQRTFVQTLTKIFAQLSVGLAVFDKERDLALFNPALLDLTGLPAERLSARPSLTAFFDHLREARVMPEPRDYAAWRKRITNLAQPGSTATYSDTWSLPSGLVYRVSGRPQPDGAVAVLIEDVTSEISLTRRFRTDLELGQGVLDSLDDALAVFSPQGVLVLTNAAYRRLWGVNPDVSLRETTRCEAIGQWQDLSSPGTDWSGLRDALAARGDAVRWQGHATLHDGTLLDLRALPLPGGAALVLFAAPDGRVGAARPAAGMIHLPQNGRAEAV